MTMNFLLAFAVQTKASEGVGVSPPPLDDMLSRCGITVQRLGTYLETKAEAG